MSDTTPTERARLRRASGVMYDFDGQRLALARRMARKPRAALAREVEVSNAAVTQFERNEVKPTQVVAAAMAISLGVPRAFFEAGQPIAALPREMAHFRSLRSTPALSRDQALAFAELALTVVGAFETYLDFPDVSVPEYPVADESSGAEIEQIATAVRAAFGLASGPVPHVIRLLESRGVVVLRLPAETVDPGVDAFSVSDAARPLVMLSPLKNDRARSRFDAAHELGHLVMHHNAEPGSKIVESQAHAFASAFLMPRGEIDDDLPRRLDWEQLIAAKHKWHVSLAALVRRAHTLGLFSDLQYQKANKQLRIEGYPERAPLGAPEQPSLLGTAASVLAEEDSMTVAELAAENRLPVELTEVVVRAGSDQRRKLSTVL